MKNIKLSIILIWIFIFSSVVISIDFNPMGDISGLGIYNIYNFTNITSNQGFIGNLTGNADTSTNTTFWSGVSSFVSRWFYDDSTVLSFNESLLNATIDIRSLNESEGDARYIQLTQEADLNVNSSTWWASLTGWSSTYFENVANILNINMSWFNSSVDARIDVAEPNLNVNQSNYWDGLNTPNDFNTITASGLITGNEFSGDINWSYLQNYPSACPANTAVTQNADSNTCTEFISTSGGQSISGALTLTDLIATNINSSTGLFSGYVTAPNQYYVSSEGTVLYQPLSASTINLASNTTLDQNLYDTNNGAMVGFTRNDGIVSGGVTIEDGAMVIDSVNGYVDSGSKLGLTNQTDLPYTFNQWLYFDNSSDMRLFSIGNTNGVFEGISVSYTQSTNTIFVQTGNGGTGTTANRRLHGYNNAFSTTGFYLLTITINSHNEFIVYINNDLKTASSTSGTSASMTIGSNNFEIGRNTLTTGSLYGNETIDYTSVHNKALSQSEITTIYNAGKDAYSPISNGLVAQYSGRDFEGTESTPTKIYDTNMIVQGKWNGSSAMVFDGVDDYVNLGDIDELDNLNEITISTWIKPHKIASGAIISKRSSTGWELWNADSGTRIRWYVKNNLVNFNTLSSMVNEWNHIVITQGRDNTVNFYHQGVLIDSDTQVDLPANSEDVLIGLRSGALNIPFNGSIGNVLIYDRALSADEIQALYLKEAPYFADNNPAGRLGDFGVRGDMSVIDGFITGNRFRTYNTNTFKEIAMFRPISEIDNVWSMTVIGSGAYEIVNTYNGSITQLLNMDTSGSVKIRDYTRTGTIANRDWLEYISPNTLKFMENGQGTVNIGTDLKISNTTTGSNAGTDLCIGANNEICRCGSCS